MVTCNYLRISVTDRCNLRCIYCSPDGRVKKVAPSNFLRPNEIIDTVSLLAEMGFANVRLTGGEPLLRKDICGLIEKIRKIPGIEDVSMTTNGLLFADSAKELKSAGLSRVNISLDSLKPERFAALTGVNGFSAVWRSVMKALELSLTPVKINTVLFKGINDDEIFDFAELTKSYDLDVRFIEHMGKGPYIANTAVFEKLKTRYAFGDKKYDSRGYGPAEYVNISGAKGFIGFISPNTKNFCKTCGRLRLSCDGKLYPCLFSPSHMDLKRAGAAPDNNIKKEIVRLIAGKSGQRRSSANMCCFGG